MGCDIHVSLEKKTNGKWVSLGYDPGCDGLGTRSYGYFAFLAGVRNYSGVMPISRPRGFPDDVSEDVLRDFEYSEGHTPSWLLLDELLSFDYSAVMEDRRCTRGNDGGCTCEPGEGSRMTWREFLGEWFFEALDEIKPLGAERIVFWFDN